MSEEPDPRNCWAYFVRPSRSTFMEDATDEESEVVGRHFNYLQGLLGEGRLIMAGPCIDGKGPGIIVFEAADGDEARATMEADPAVVAGVFSAELHPFRASLLRGRD
ncbi:MAG TPA: YciI family protein [Rubrobacter sp.]|nr:YciI family protein [Rubrobacter sp.]